ncbi:MAG TPA: cyclodeaminase/cyclohydrolase family protein [Candidatus Binatia bacterium]|nr:cyclodeaminase/cyclohydrolase family protein [Candidatus Binatia bacterium]
METLDEYLRRLASHDPVPGGGSAAALIGAVAAALVAMVGRIASAPLEDVVDEADRLRDELAAARLRDEAAFAAVVAAQALPKDDEAQVQVRREALDAALQGAAEEPLRAAGLALRVLELALRLSEAKTKALASDVGCAAEFAHAALAGCAYNVRVNHKYMHETEVIACQAEMLASYERDASNILELVRAAVGAALARR